MSLDPAHAFGSQPPFGSDASPSADSAQPSWAVVAGIAAGVWGLSELGLLVSTLSGQASPVWPAAGLGVWAALRFGPRALWGVLVGALLSKVLADLPWSAAISALGPVLEAWLGAAVIHRMRETRLQGSRRAGEVLAWLLAGAVGPQPSVLLGVGPLWASGVVPTPELGVVALTWWVGDLFGIVLLVPLLETWRVGQAEVGRLWKQPWRPMVVVVATLTACLLGLGLRESGGLIFLLFPPLLLGKLWGGRLGTQMVAVLIATAAVIATATGHGPFDSEQLNDGLLRMEVFLVGVVITALALPLFRDRGSFRLGATVLLAGWTMGAVVYHLHRRTESLAEASHLRGEVESAMDALQDRMTIYTEALRGGVALFNTAGEVNHAQWRRFADSLRMHESYPGINGIGVIWPAAAADLPSFVSGLGRDRGAPFAMHEVPGVERPTVAPGDPEHFVIGFIEPEPTNWQAIGLDVGSEANRRQAALEARDSGEARMTKRIVLVQDGEKRAGFLLYLPVYANDLPLRTVAERRAAFRHWVYAPFVTAHFVQGVLPNVTQELRLDLFEGRSTAERDLLFDSAGADDGREAGAVTPPRYDAVTELTLAGEPFTLGWTVTDRFARPYAIVSSWIGTGLALASLAAAGLVTLLQVSEKRAQSLVADRTAELESAQARMAELIALQRGVLDSHNFAFISVDLEGIIRSFNRGAERLLGYTAAEVIGQITPAQFHLPSEMENQAKLLSGRLGETVAPTMEVFVALSLRGLKDEGEWTYVRKDGAHVPVKLSISTITNEAGQPMGFLGVAQDLTAHRRAEASRRAAMVELSVLKQALDQHVEISVADVDGSIVYANQRFCENSGYSHDELMGHDHRLLKSGEHPREFFAELWQTLLRGENWRGDIRNRAKDGRLYWVDTLIVPELNEQGVPRRFVSVRIDVTRNRDYEQGLAQARDEALHLSRLKTEFLANISHELRTPMNGIIGMATLLTDSGLAKDSLRMAEVIRQSGENLLTIINDILDLSKMEAGKMRLTTGDFDLASMLRDAIELLVPRVDGRPVSLRCEIPPGSDWSVHGDEGRLRQVVINLLGNAIKFTEAGTVALRLVEHPSLSRNREFRIEVEDTGPGIPLEVQDRLFQAFVQADGSDTRVHGGTGLGLSISRQIIEIMGGRIGLHSEPGLGSTFWVEFALPRGAKVAPPVAPASADPVSANRMAGAPSRAARSNGPKLRLLLVEDNQANQEVARIMLGRMGHEVTVANHGEEGLACLAKARFDVVLMDCQMPVMDGFQATRLLRAGGVPGADARVPVVALTAYAMPGDRERCRDAGMDDYLTKPLRAREVTDLLQRFGAAHAGEPEAPDPAAAESAEPVLDNDVVSELLELHTDGGETVFVFIARQFLNEWSDELADLEQRAAAGDWSEFVMRVHRFGGGAALFGGMAVRRLSLELEKLAKQGETTAAQAGLPKLRSACEKLAAAVMARLAEVEAGDSSAV